MSYFLASEASRYLNKKGLNISTAALRLAQSCGHIKAQTTETKVRLFEQADLDAFFELKKTKKSSRQLETA